MNISDEPLKEIVSIVVAEVGDDNDDDGDGETTVEPSVSACH